MTMEKDKKLQLVKDLIDRKITLPEFQRAIIKEEAVPGGPSELLTVYSFKTEAPDEIFGTDGSVLTREEFDVKHPPPKWFNPMAPRGYILISIADPPNG
jgi:hypothetical protein